MEDETEKHFKSPLIPRWFWILALVIVSVWFFAPQIIQWHGGKAPPDKAGEFGDQFGAINTLFSGLAFLGVLVSIFIQGKEFRSQLKEMAVNAEEMQKQSVTYEEQLKMLKRQNDLLSHQLINAQVQERLATQPFIMVELNRFEPDHAFFTLQNDGATIYGLTVAMEDASWANPCVLSTLSGEGGRVPCQITFDQPDFSDKPMARRHVELSISYVTRLGHPMKELFHINYGQDSRNTSHSDMIDIGRKIREEVGLQHVLPG